MFHLRRLLLVLTLGTGFLAGCSGAKEKGKNQDYDRPRSTAKS